MTGSTIISSRSKTPFNLTLSGITNDDVDLSVDALKAVTLPLLRLFGVAEEGRLELTVRVARAMVLEVASSTICYFCTCAHGPSPRLVADFSE